MNRTIGVGCGLRSDAERGEFDVCTRWLGNPELDLWKERSLGILETRDESI
jgi:hypothetical protein